MLRAFAPTLFGEQYGDAPARVVALPGWARTHDDFDAVLSGLDAIALDLPGWGASPPPAEAWGAADYAGAVAAVLHDLRSPTVLVGHSFGGRVAVHLAAGHPELLSGLVLTGVPLLRRDEFGARRPATSYRIAKVLRRVGVLSATRFEEIRFRYSAPDWKAAEGVMRDIFTRVVNETYEEQLRRITCPVELVWGEDDTAAPPTMLDEVVRLLAGPATVTRLPGVGHLTPMAAPAAIREAIARLLA